MVIWITGLPGSGKTTIANELYKRLVAQKKQVVLLDGDQLRNALSNFNYDNESRLSLAMTYSRLCKMFSSQGQFVICATVSMFDVVREWNYEHNPDYYEIYLKVSKETLYKRDKKQLYTKAKADNEKNVVGADLDYEEPKNPNLTITDKDDSPLTEMIELIIKDIAKWV